MRVTAGLKFRGILACPTIRWHCGYVAMKQLATRTTSIVVVALAAQPCSKIRFAIQYFNEMKPCFSLSTIIHYINGINAKNNIIVLIFVQAIAAEISARPFSSASSVCNALDLQCSLQTVRNRHHSIGVHGRRPALKPLLTDTHKEERVQYALEYSDMPEHFWQTVVFCDEKTFSSDGLTGTGYVWRPSGTRYLSNTSFNNLVDIINRSPNIIIFKIIVYTSFIIKVICNSHYIIVSL